MDEVSKILGPSCIYGKFMWKVTVYKFTRKQVSRIFSKCNSDILGIKLSEKVSVSTFTQLTENQKT